MSSVIARVVTVNIEMMRTWPLSILPCPQILKIISASAAGGHEFRYRADKKWEGLPTSRIDRRQVLNIGSIKVLQPSISTDVLSFMVVLHPSLNSTITELCHILDTTHTTGSY